MSWLSRTFNRWFGDKKRTDRQTQRSEYDQWATDHARGISQYAQQQRGFNPYTGTLNAMYGDSNYAQPIRLAGDYLAQTSPEELGGTLYDPSTASGFIDKYMQATQPYMDDIAQQEAMAKNAARAESGWGDRSYIQEGIIGRNADRSREGLISNAINQGIGMGYNAHNAHIQNQQYGFNNYLAGAQNIGSLMQGIDQGNLDRNYMNWQYNQDQPWRELGYEQGILSGLPLNTTGTTTRNYTQKNTLLPSLFKTGITAAAIAAGGPAGAAGASGGGGFKGISSIFSPGVQQSDITPLPYNTHGPH